MDDEWHIRIDRRYLHNEAGAGARRKERELAAGRSGLARFLDRVTDARTEDRSWRRGAEGEERVAALLERHLDRERWALIHDLTVGTRGANLDHLVIGPPGVFVLNTKNLSGNLTVYKRAIYQNGHKTSFVPSALREAKLVQERLSATVRFPVAAWSVLVMAGNCTIETRDRLTDFTVTTARELAGWLPRIPHRRIEPREVLRLERAARDPATWQPPRRSRPQHHPEQPPRAAAPRSQPPPPSADAVLEVDPSPARSTGRGGVSVRRWTRYGKDRFYANAADGTRLGFIDVATGEITLEVADELGLVSAQLRAARHAVVPGSPQGPGC